jgi:hypothetical protein
MPTRRFFGPILILSLVLVCSGCVSTGVFQAANLTNVGLEQGNYRLVATNVAGEASAAYVIGFSAAIGSEMRTVALFRLEGDPLLYQQALTNLWTNFEQTNGSVIGRSLALVNVRFDSDAQNYLVYTRPRISVRADVVEFIQ